MKQSSSTPSPQGASTSSSSFQQVFELYVNVCQTNIAPSYTRTTTFDMS